MSDIRILTGDEGVIAMQYLGDGFSVCGLGATEKEARQMLAEKMCDTEGVEQARRMLRERTREAGSR